MINNKEVLQIDFHLLASGKLKNGHHWPVQTNKKKRQEFSLQPLYWGINKEQKPWAPSQYFLALPQFPHLK